jgi:CubicO group peptidase (beta-lactamase class C family)
MRKRKLIAAWCGLLSILLPVSSQGQTNPDPALDAAFDATMERYRLPGLAVGLVENGRVVYARTAGERVAGSGEKIDRQTLFKIGSDTKAMTAALIGRLVDAGKLKWGDPVVQHLPQFRMSDPWVTRQAQIRDLLVHDLGFRTEAGDLMLWPEPNSFTRADVVRALPYLKPLYSFRSHFSYSNLGYIVAGEVAAAAGGAPYDQLLRRMVFEPLGMTRCQIGEWRRDAVGNVAQPHMRKGDRNVPVRLDGEVIPVSAADAAGGVRCSLDDMLTWVLAWLKPQGRAQGWLSDQQRQQMWSVQMPTHMSALVRKWDNSHFAAYGYGWHLADVDGVFKVWHTGTLMGMYSSVTMLPDMGVGIVILSNGAAGEARLVLNELLEKRYTRPHEKRDIAYFAGFFADQSGKPAPASPVTPPPPPPLNKADFAYSGVYRDPWFGEVSVCPDGDGVRWRSQKSPLLNGKIVRVGERLQVVWDAPSVDADAWLDFAKTKGRTAMRMTGGTHDDSYDYEDLNFQRVRACGK